MVAQCADSHRFQEVEMILYRRLLPLLEFLNPSSQVTQPSMKKKTEKRKREKMLKQERRERERRREQERKIDWEVTGRRER